MTTQALKLVLTLLAVLPLAAQTAVTLTPAASPSAGQAGVTNITLTGSGFPTGTIQPADTDVWLEPAASGAGATVTIKAATVTLVVGSTRRVAFLLPASIQVTSPTPYLASVTGKTTTGAAFASSNKATLTINPSARLLSLTPNSGQLGQTLAVTLRGEFTNFVQGATQAVLGPGVPVGNAAEGALGPVTVVNSTTATAQLRVNAAATLGPRDVTVRTGAQQATLPGAFLVTGPVITLTSPAPLTYTNISPITVNGTVSDPSATVTVNSVQAVNSGGSFSVAVPLLEGPNTLTAVARSASGATGTATLQVTLDTTPPRVTIESPPNGFVTYDAAIGVAGNVNDIVVGTVNEQQAQVTVNGLPSQVANRAFSASNVPLTLGDNVIQAVGRDRTGNASTTSIVVRREAPPPARIRLVSGNEQSAVIGSRLPLPLLVALTESNNQPAANKTVIFKVTKNDGAVSPSSTSPGQPTAAVQTNAQGQAQVFWTLGARSGAASNALEAYAVGFAGTALFTATGTQSPAGKIVVDTGGGQIGAVNQPLPKPLIAVVVDQGNNRVGGVPVTFTVKQGGGSFAGAPTFTVNTDSDGRAAAILTLGYQEGNENNLVEANFPGNPGFPVTFTASGRAPGNPANTQITGVVLDNSNVPIPGVTIRAVLTDQLSMNSSVVAGAITSVTDQQGQFKIQPAPVGFVKLLIDGDTAQRVGTYPNLDYDMVTVAGQVNTLGMPIFLLPLNEQNKLCVTATTGGGTLTAPEAPGFSLTFGPGQVTFPGNTKEGCVSVTVVHPDKVPMVPGFGQQPRFIVTIQPAGALFNPPAPLTIPNVDGLKPGHVTEMYSFDHDIGSFVAIGTGTVSEDGRVIRSNPGVGVLKAGWHCGGDPMANGSVADCGVCRFCQGNVCVTDPSQANKPCHQLCVSGRSGVCLNGNCVGGQPLPPGADCGECVVGGTCIDGGFCFGGTPRPDGASCGVCLSGATCSKGICSGGSPSNDGLPCGLCRVQSACSAGECIGGQPKPSGSLCGPCMSQGASCNGHGQCVGGSPLPNGTPCGDGNSCYQGACRAPISLSLLWNGRPNPERILIRQGLRPYANSLLQALASPPGGTFSWTVSDPSTIDLSVVGGVATILGRRSGSTEILLSYTTPDGATRQVGTPITVISPLILSHGLISSASAWTNLINALQARGLLYDRGFCRGDLTESDFCAVDFGSDPFVPGGNQGDFTVQGYRLAQAIISFRAASLAAKVTLVGHSMGGLASRAAIQLHQQADSVGRLITIGTPHLGSPLASVLAGPLAAFSILPAIVAIPGLPGIVSSLPGVPALQPNSSQLTLINSPAILDRLPGPPNMSHVSLIGESGPTLSAVVLGAWAGLVAATCSVPVPGTDCDNLRSNSTAVEAMFGDGDLLVATRSQNINNIAPGIALRLQAETPVVRAVHTDEITQVDVFLKALGIP